ncbi:MAG: hypothetical protein FD167_909 [bacterium]|nr:MAG: hypothetical protein FD167_909 [bacterium]
MDKDAFAVKEINLPLCAQSSSSPKSFFSIALPSKEVIPEPQNSFSITNVSLLASACPTKQWSILKVFASSLTVVYKICFGSKEARIEAVSRFSKASRSACVIPVK